MFQIRILPSKNVVARIAQNTHENAFKSRIQDTQFVSDPHKKTKLIRHFTDLLRDLRNSSTKIIGLTINPRIAATLNNHDRVLLVKILVFISINNYELMTKDSSLIPSLSRRSSYLSNASSDSLGFQGLSEKINVK